MPSENYINIDAELFLEKNKLITLLEFDQPQQLRTFSRIVMRVKVQCLQSQQLSEWEWENYIFLLFCPEKIRKL